MEFEKKYNQTEVAKITGYPQSTLSDISNRLHIGCYEDNKRVYTQSEVNRLKNYKVKNHMKLIEIIKKHQPILIKDLVRISEFSTKKTMTLLTDISGTLDDPPIDANIWEDHEDKLYYKWSHYKRVFFGDY